MAICFFQASGGISPQSAPMESYITKQSWERIPPPWVPLVRIKQVPPVLKGLDDRVTLECPPQPVSVFTNLPRSFNGLPYVSSYGHHIIYLTFFPAIEGYLFLFFH